MSTVGGEFNETLLLQTRDRADRMMLDDRIKQQFIPKIAMYDYVRSLQTASINAALNARSGKEYDVEVMWMNACEDFSMDDNSCALGTQEVSTNTQTYKLEKRIVKGFAVYDYKFRDNEFNAEEAIAKSLLQIDKQISEEFTRHLVTRLDSFAGINQVGTAENRLIDGNVTYIPPEEWTAELMAYFSRVAIMNRFTNPVMVTGHNMYESMYVARAKQGDFDAGKDYVLWNGMPIWFDMFNMDSVLDDYTTFMVSQGAIAMASKTWNPDAPFRSFDDIRYTMPSRFLNGMKYDVFYSNRCYPKSTDSTQYAAAEGYQKDTLLHQWKVVLTADLFLNPFGCDATEDDDDDIGGENSGVLKFVNGEADDS